MKSLKKNQSGFGAIEAILLVVIAAALVGVGWYVLKAKKNTTTNYNNAAASTNTTKTATQTTPDQVLSQLAKAMKVKNKANFEALVSPEMKAAAKANGVTSTYDSLASDQFSAAIFTQVDYTKYKPVVKDYTSKAGVKGGKQLIYTIVTTVGGAKSTNVYTFDFVPKANSWLLDDMALDFNGSSNVSTP